MRPSVLRPVGPARRRQLPVFVASSLLAASLVAGCSGESKPAGPPPFDRANLDTTCAPCKDFYQFANGGWLKKTTIPAAYGSYGAFYEVDDRNRDILHTILDKSAADVNAGKAVAGSGPFKVGAFYAACMDTVTIDKLGTAPLKPILDAIDAIKTPADLAKALSSLEHRFGLAPWGDGATQDARDATSMIVGLYQGGISLPDRDYYFKTDSATKKIREGFVAHLERMFKLLGESPEQSTADAKTVMAIETKFAQASKSPAALRDPVANYHKMAPAELAKLTPHIEWMPFFAEQGASDVKAVDVGQPEFFKAADGMITSVPVNDWKVLLRWRAIHGAAPALGTDFVNENFKFNQMFSGAKQLRERWKRCATQTDDRVGELLGQEYVKDNFPPDAKERAVKIVNNLVAELNDRLGKLDWMSTATKTQALAKLAAFNKKIGYPDKWRDYSRLEIKKGEHLANVIAATQWAASRDWAKVGKPIDRSEWGMTPPTVNAYYTPLWNEIVFPAGILQPPFYDPKADDAMNYGAMGAVIGHEMTHGFDDQGRQFDKDGNLKDWWSKEDAAKYLAEAKKVIQQFNAYTVIDSATHVNGELTLGENIADFGGLTIAYAAMERALGSSPRTKIDGFTPEQRFFLGWAQVWRELYRDQALRAQVNSNEHSPSIWRVNGPLSNMPEFKAAFGCKDGDAMVRPEAARARIW